MKMLLTKNLKKYTMKNSILKNLKKNNSSMLKIFLNNNEILFCYRRV